MIARAEAALRASRVKLVITDNDGVLTDTGVYYSERGEELKRYSVRDGMGVERLRCVGIATAILTREAAGSVRSRAAKLGLSHVYTGVRDKRAHLEVILQDAGVAANEVAYIGDDVNDLEILSEVAKGGLTAAPADAIHAVREAVQFRCEAKGGHGAFRDFAESILALREEAAALTTTVKARSGDSA